VCSPVRIVTLQVCRCQHSVCRIRSVGADAEQDSSTRCNNSLVEKFRPTAVLHSTCNFSACPEHSSFLSSCEDDWNEDMESMCSQDVLFQCTIEEACCETGAFSGSDVLVKVTIGCYSPAGLSVPSILLLDSFDAVSQQQLPSFLVVVSDHNGSAEPSGPKERPEWQKNSLLEPRCTSMKQSLCAAVGSESSGSSCQLPCGDNQGSLMDLSMCSVAQELDACLNDVSPSFTTLATSLVCAAAETTKPRRPK
jgi:hypothetical protein